MASQGTKGNPASKRMSNPHYKEKFARAWKRSQEKKAKRRAENEARHKANLAARARDEFYRTPWERAEMKRKERRLEMLKEREAATGSMQLPRTEAGNILLQTVTVDAAGRKHVTTLDIRPCCYAKSYKHCPHVPQDLRRMRFLHEPLVPRR